MVNEHNVELEQRTEKENTVADDLCQNLQKYIEEIEEIKSLCFVVIHAQIERAVNSRSEERIS